MKPQQVLNNLDHSSKDITEILSAIDNPECQLKSRELLKVFIKNLEMLKRNYLLLTESEFYLDVAKALEQTKHRLKAVDPLQADWGSHSALLNYYETNLQAMTRGVQITRIFVINHQDLLNRNIQKTLSKQHQDGIDVRITYLEDLQLISNESFVGTLNFAIYNDALVADRASDNGSYFGKSTKNPVEIKKYTHLFDLIDAHSHRFTSEKIQSQLQLIDLLPI